MTMKNPMILLSLGASLWAEERNQGEAGKKKYLHMRYNVVLLLPAGDDDEALCSWRLSSTSRHTD